MDTKMTCLELPPHMYLCTYTGIQSSMYPNVNTQYKRRQTLSSFQKAWPTGIQGRARIGCGRRAWACLTSDVQWAWRRYRDTRKGRRTPRRDIDACTRSRSRAAPVSTPSPARRHRSSAASTLPLAPRRVPALPPSPHSSACARYLRLQPAACALDAPSLLGRPPIMSSTLPLIHSQHVACTRAHHTQ